MLVPIKLPSDSPLKEKMNVIAADVGGTKTHLALFEEDKGKIKLIKEQKFSSNAYETFESILDEFEWGGRTIDGLCVAFAGPILDGRAEATNLDWVIDEKALSKKMNLSNVTVINDLEASAFGLRGMESADLKIIQVGNPNLKGNAAVLSPGTGLGEAGMFWDGDGLVPFATEGGHADFAPRDDFDDALLRHLRAKHGHVSWERVLSGTALVAIYKYLDGQSKEGNSLNCRDASEISDGAKNGDKVCLETFRVFYKYLAVEGANLVVKFMATGGLYIGGGVVPKNLELLDIPLFLEHFADLGRFKYLLEQVPVYIILNQNSALLGAGYHAVYAK